MLHAIPRRFPPPWTLDEHNNACFIVKDASGQALDYFYFEDEPGRHSAAKLLTRDKAGRMAVNFDTLDWCAGRSRLRKADYSPFIFRRTHALTSTYFACSPNSARQPLTACILALGVAWIAATETVSTTTTATPRKSRT